MTKKWVTIIGLMCTLSLLVVGCAKPAAPEKPIELQWAAYMPIGHTSTLACEDTIEAIETRSEGRIKVTWFPAQQLLKAKEIFDGVAAGRVEMGGTALPYCEGDIPLVMILGLPLVWKSFDHLRAGMEPLRDALQGEYAKKGVYLVGICPYGVFYSPFSNKSIPYTPADIKGQKIRVSGKALIRFVELCGASPVYFSAPDTYTALQRGTVDGHIFVPGSFYNYHYEEVTKYGARVDISVPVFSIIANLSWWQGLTKEQRKIIQDAVTEFGVKGQMETWFASEDKMWEKLKQDLEIGVLTEEQKAAWFKVGEIAVQEVVGELGPDAQKILDAIKKYER